MSSATQKRAAGGAGAEARRALRGEVRSQALVLGGTLALLWLLEILDLVAFHGRLDQLGIKPRTARGLIGVPLHPFLHVGLGHLAANSAGMLFAGWFIVNRRRRDFFLVWACATLIGGIGTWLIAPSASTHLGASGVVMGLMGFLVARGWFERRFFAILASLVMTLILGGTILGGLFPDDPRISWQVHLFGFAGGILAARLARTRR
jgi:membrane associated rhomboid family serine protease